MFVARANKLLLSAAFITLLSAGCGGSDKYLGQRPATVAAEGTVLYKGKPVVGATIVAAPVEGSHAAAAVTDSAGKFKLSAFPPKAGAVPGDYNVTISAIEPAPVIELPEGVHEDDIQRPPPKHLIPERYSDPVKSGLKMELYPEGRTDLDFELTD
jgi:hypothetical protein